MPYRILFMLVLAAVIAYVQRAAISVPALEIAADFGLSESERWMGYLQSAWYLGYALCQLPSGWLADRYGPRRMIVCYALLWSVLTGFAGLVPLFPLLFLVWTLMGAAQAGIFPCATKTIRGWFPDTKRARASGWLSFGMNVGGAVAPILTATLLSVFASAPAQLGIYRWQVCLLLYALPGIAWAVLYFYWTPEKIELHPPTPTGEKTAPAWRDVFGRTPVLLLCGQQFFRAAGMVFFLTWFPTFLQKTRGVSILASGALTTCAALGMMLGSLVGGYGSDWVLRTTGNRRLARQGLAVIGMSLCSALILVSYFVANTTIAIALITIGAFGAMVGGVSGYTVAIELGGKNVATVFSTMNMCGNFGAMLFPLTVSWLVTISGNWNLALFLFAIIMGLAALCWAFLHLPPATPEDPNDARG